MEINTQSYYCEIDGEEFGPYSPIELYDQSVEEDTPVWCEGMEDWKEAGSIHDLAPLFLHPPPLPKSMKATDSRYHSSNLARPLFKSPFLPEGRIRRLEYGFTTIIFWVTTTFSNALLGTSQTIQTNHEPSGTLLIFSVILIIVSFWFMLAQGAKRCHDIGKSGWYQLIPFFPIILLFSEGDRGLNSHGSDPKGRI